MPETNSAMQDMLKQIHIMHQKNRKVTNKGLSEAMHMRPSSVTKTLKRLSQLGYITHESYGTVDLSKKGWKAALEVIRHHRLIELYLFRDLGYSLEEVHGEAEALEHAISEKLEARLAKKLGSVTVDPHGHPIPTEDGRVFEHRYGTLDHYSIGETLQVMEVDDADSEALRYVTSLGISPGSSVKILGKEPYDGPLKLKVDSRLASISPRLAGMVYVKNLSEMDNNGQGARKRKKAKGRF